MEPFGLTQLVSEPTRVTGDSSTLLDHVYANCPENVNSLNIPKIGLSEHFSIFLHEKCMCNLQRQITLQYHIEVLRILINTNLLRIFNLFHAIP